MNILKIVYVIILITTIQNVNAQSLQTSIQYSGVPAEVITDLRNSLHGYRAGTITIHKVPLTNRTGQEFYLSSVNGITEIKYTTQNSLENAVYTYLDLLGFRWYGPGDHWFVKPKTLPALNIPGQWMQPSFRNRSFFGTGGLDFGSTQAYDPDNQYKQKWYDWKRRNRFNADFAGVGHTGQAFYLANRNILDANPRWFAGESGKVNGRIKIEQTGAVNAYKNWIRNIYKNSKTAFTVLGVDPEDGRGGEDDPLPPRGFKGIQNWNHADKWWWLANEVAKDYPEDDKTTVVSMYAYGDGPYNALAPSFPLRKNVYPVIIPYAFQKAYLPDEMVKVWASKITGKMGLYDYWNITQWSQGLPQFNIYFMQPKLQFWTKHKVDGIYLETTDAAGPMGHALWLTGQLQWDVNKNFEKLYQQYLTDCFGKAAPVMRRMYDRWSRNYQGAGEVAFSLDDLKDASALIQKNSPEWKRLNDLKAYVHFMKLYYEHDGTAPSRDKIFRYLYSIHHLMLVQTAAFIGQGYISPGGAAPSAAGIRRLSAEDIEKQFLQDIKIAPKSYQLVDFDFDYDKVKYTEPIPETSWLFGNFQCNFFFKAPFSGEFIIDVGVYINNDLTLMPFTFYTEDKVIIREQLSNKKHDYIERISDRAWAMTTYRINIQKGKTYYLSTMYGANRTKIKTKGIVLFKNPGIIDFDNYAYPVQYFYVPQNTREIIFYDAQPEGTNGRGYLITPDGKTLKREITGAKDIYRVPVQPSQAGKIWTANFGHPTWSFKNIPNITSLQKFAYKE